MRRLGVVAVVIGITLLAAPTRSRAQPTHGRPLVYELALTGPIDPLLARYTDRAIAKARHDAAAAVLVRLDTPGGLDSSMLADKLPAMCGRETFAMAVSRTSMNVAMVTTSATTQGL